MFFYIGKIVIFAVLNKKNTTMKKELKQYFVNIKKVQTERVSEMKKTLNTISDEARANAEAAIAAKQAEIDAITEIIKELEAAEDDKSEELMAKVAELMSKSAEIYDRVSEIENKIKNGKGMKIKDFVNSKKGQEVFLSVVKNSTTASEFKENWKTELSKNGISPEDVLLPSPIVEEINTKWADESANFLTLLDITGLKAIKVAYDSNDTDTSRAHGHKKGTKKGEEEIVLVPKEIRAQLIYKYITIDRETLDFEDEGALARYIAGELAAKIIQEIMRAVLVGDGRSASDNGKISKIESVSRDTSDDYVTVSFAADDIPTIEEVAAAIDEIDAEGDIVVFMSKKTARALQTYKVTADGSVMYKTLEDVAAQLGVYEIRTTRLLNEAGLSKPRVVAFVGKAYKIVGDMTMAGFEDFNLEYNKREFLTEVYAGGALATPKSGAVVKSKNA